LIIGAEKKVGPNREKVTGGRRKFHNRLYNL